MTNLERFIDDNRAHNFIEDQILASIVSALNDQHDPIISVFDGYDDTMLGIPGDLREIQLLVFNLDECYLKTATGWVRFILGEGWDALCDYTTNLDDALSGVNDWIDRHN